MPKTQAEGHWECEEGCGRIADSNVYSRHRFAPYHEYYWCKGSHVERHKVKFIPSPIETPEVRDDS